MGVKNSLKIQKDGKCGIANIEGKIVIKPEYADILQLGEDNKSGYIVKNESGKYGIVDYSDTTVLQCEYDEVTKYMETICMLLQNQVSKILVNKDGTEAKKIIQIIIQ